MNQRQCLLVVDWLLLELALHITEQLLNRIEPGAVLGIEDDVHLESSTGLKHRTVSVHHCVVHEQDDSSCCSLLVIPDLVEELEDECFKESGVKCTLNDLRANDFVLGDGSNEGHGVLLPLAFLLANGELKTLVAILAKAISEKLLVLLSHCGCTSWS